MSQLAGRLDRIEEQLEELAAAVREITGERRGRRWRSYRDIAAEGQWSERQLRHWQQTDPSFRACIVRKGRRIFVDLDAFELWLEADQEPRPAHHPPIPAFTGPRGFLDPQDPRRKSRRTDVPAQTAGALG